MDNIKDLSLEEIDLQLRIKIFIAVSIAVNFTLLVYGVVNFRMGDYLIGVLQIVLVIVLSVICFLARKGKHIEIYSSLVLYTITAEMLYNMVKFGKTDLGPYVAIIGLVIVAYFITRLKWAILVYGALVYVCFLLLTIFKIVPLNNSVSIKFQAIYIALVAVAYINRIYDYRRMNKYIEATAQALELNKKLSETLKSERQSKEESEKLNKVMVDRELRMIELKEKLKEQ